MKKLSGAIIAIATLLTGCASQNVKHAVTTFDQSDLAYGAVLKTKPLDIPTMEAGCKKRPNDAWDSVCNDLTSYEQVQLAVLHSSRLVTAWIVTPTAWKVQPLSIIQLNPKRAAIGTRLVAVQPRQDCQWTGRSLDDLTSGTGMVKGFVAGMLIVPAVAVALDDTILEGGVECEGWSYKSLLQPVIAR